MLVLYYESHRVGTAALPKNEAEQPEIKLSKEGQGRDTNQPSSPIVLFQLYTWNHVCCISTCVSCFVM